MALKKITFAFIALLILCDLSGHGKAQTSQTGPIEDFHQYLPLVSYPSPYDVYVKSYSEYIQGTDHYVVGELANQTDTMFYEGYVVVEILGQNNNFTSRTFMTFIRCLNPRSTTPFKVVFSGLSEPAKVRHIYWGHSNYPEYPPCQTAQVVSQNYHDSFGTQFNIQVSNPSPKPMYGLTIAVTLYDSSGRVVGVDKDSYLTYYPPHSGGSDSPVESINTSYRANQFTSYKVQAEGFTSEGDTFP